MRPIRGAENRTAMAWPIQAYIEDCQLRLARRTWQTYRNVLQDAERRTGVSLQGLSARHFGELSRSWGHRDQSLSALRCFLRWVGHPLAGQIPHGIPTTEHRQLVWYTLAELEAIVAACSTPRERLVVHLACELMLRRIEVERLTWADLEELSIHVLGKGRHGGKWRRIPWHPLTRELIEAFISTKPTRSMAVETSRRRKRFTTRSIAGARTEPGSLGCGATNGTSSRGLIGLRKSALDLELKRIQESLRWQGVNLSLQFHALRRTGGRLYVQAGISIGKDPLVVLNELRGIYGHADLRTTIAYIGWDLGEAAVTMAAMPQLGNAGASPAQSENRTAEVPAQGGVWTGWDGSPPKVARPKRP